VPVSHFRFSASGFPFSSFCCLVKSTQPFEITPPDAPGGWIGTDEAGKGDYFGPLVVAGV
jgi:hypothetical protein